MNYICILSFCTFYNKCKLVHFKNRQGLGHESLTGIMRFALILASALDPGSLVRRALALLTSLRLSRPRRGIDKHRKAGKSLLFLCSLPVRDSNPNTQDQNL